MRQRTVFFILFYLTPFVLLAQIPYSQQKDASDVLRELFHIKKPRKSDSSSLKEGGRVIAILPTPGYAPQSGLFAQVVSNVTIRNTNANVSILNLVATFTEFRQSIFQYTTSYFTKDNRFYFSNDWRWMDYPQATYGLGMNTTRQNKTEMNFRYLRLYQTLMRSIGKNRYIGIGYQYDYHWHIESYAQGTRVEEISGYKMGVNGKSVSSGPTIAFLYDSRTNAMSATQGLYTNVVFRQNLKSLGSNTNYQSLLVDARKYFDLAGNTNHILALWSYNMFTHGNVPYLDMPSTGWDTNVNMGRGFIQGRFRGKNLMYLEAEYRFTLTRSHFIGGVLFSNIQTVSEITDNRFRKAIPAIGTGLRIRINKFSKANLAIDFAVGRDGSRNIYFNFGEVF
ncbi:BamA/TamA family outer membrane protein [Emticicia sp. TH156]|uniref:BamA/TamA family outer membrane protein n=1 Tax=Emticicia sp. TH156 TaxID=2067454 RepID=UPI000C756592|nr:BamA/TamA family outer membrane protein [Emticicia sp. TH156]PLK45940.1 hypothetical protein C0V77_00875 [Emticicia sp. TH156]